VATTEMTNLLSRFGVNYPEAPAPTPAMLAFMRGLGMNLDTADAARRKAISRVEAGATDAMGDIQRGEERTKRNATADLIRRGVLSSGEANTRYANIAEDVADRKSGVTRQRTEGVDAAETAFGSLSDNYRQQALERMIGVEQEQITRKATSDAQAASYKQQTEESDLAYQRQKAAQEEYLTRMENLYKTYGA
jgi:hypothetical protein